MNAATRRARHATARLALVPTAVLAAGLITALAGDARSAGGQKRTPAKSGTAVDRRARAAYRRGARLFSARDFLGAIEAFKRAYALQPAFLLQCNIARCYESRGQLVRASRHYARCLAEGGASSARAAELTRAKRAVDRRIAKLRIVGTGAKVQVDGRARGRAPATIALDPGEHAVELRDGGRVMRQTLLLRAGERRTLELTGDNDATPPHLASPSPPRARRDGKTTRPDAWHRKLHPAWFWTALSISAGLAVAATVFGVLTLDRNSDYENAPTRERLDAVYSARRVANILWGSCAAMAAVSGGVLLFSDFRGTRAPSGRTVAAWIGGVWGRF